jgi:hypothetical protein
MTAVICSGSQAVTQGTPPTVELHHVTRCVQEIMRRHFTPGTPVLVTAPSTQQSNLTQRALTSAPSSTDNLTLADLMLHNLQSNALWPILFVIPADAPLDEANYVTIKLQNYVIFIWEEYEADIVEDILPIQLEYLQDSMSWNSRAKFIVIVNTSVRGFTRSLALRICETLWSLAKIANVVVLIPSAGEETFSNDEKDKSLHEVSRRFGLDLYTFFPFQKENCGEVKDVNLLDQWVYESDWSLSSDKNLYQTKIPQNFLGCPIKVASIATEPYVMVAEIPERNDGSSFLKPSGISVEPLIYTAEKLNITLIFLEPSFDLTLTSCWKQFNKVIDGEADILIGAIPYISTMADIFDPTIPYIYDSMTMLIPCPGRIARIDMITNVYATSVWIALALVFILTAIVFWCAANYGPHMESYSFRHLSNCFQSAWAIFMGVSVSEMPRTSKLRILFLLYVCYCFAISTVFQAFFTSFLVETGYERGIQTLEELLQSDLFYGYNTALEFLFSQVAFGHTRLYSRPRAECLETRKCVEQVIFHRNMTTLFSKICINYIASTNGVDEKARLICFLDDGMASGNAAAYLPKGSLFLNRINPLLLRYSEAGLQNRYWSLLTWGERLKSKANFAINQDFVPFSVSHLTPAFIILLSGYILGFGLLLVELAVKLLRERRP